MTGGACGHRRRSPALALDLISRSSIGICHRKLKGFTPRGFSLDTHHGHYFISNYIQDLDVYGETSSLFSYKDII
ncbi:unnamed protein product [Knipowitschia caucasica]